MSGPKPQDHRPDVDSWHEAALAYLGRFASSAENLRRVLRRRALRQARMAGIEPDWPSIEPVIETVLVRLARAGLIDDASYAGLRTESLHRRGESTRRIRARLSAKGVGRDAIDGALSDLETRDPDADFRAACRLALRRRLGPGRPKAQRAAARARDLAALARAGFDYATARRVLDLADEEALRAAVAETG